MNYRFPYSSEVARDTTGECSAAYDQEVLEGFTHDESGWYDTRVSEWALLLSDLGSYKKTTGSVFLTLLSAGCLIVDEKNYTITEALTIVRDAALEGKKLEAWCDGDPVCSIGYVEIGGEFKWMWRIHNSGFIFKVGVFDINEVLDSWHVREVTE